MYSKPKAPFEHSHYQTSMRSTVPTRPKSRSQNKASRPPLGDGSDSEPEPGPAPVPAPAPAPAPADPAEDDVDDPIDAPKPDVPWRKVKDRKDGFYKYWNHFNRAGKLKPWQEVRGAKKSVSDGKDKGETTEKQDTGSEGVVPSLDTDVEGNPGHKVEQDSEGVVVRSQPASASYDSAVENCRAKVRAIVQECKRLNQKYYDRTFELPSQDTLLSLAAREAPRSIKGLQGVGAVKRVEDIYEDPEFFEDGATVDDVRQGKNGDCWFLAALTALSGDESLIEKICVERDEQAGVYGFVFFRDGEWVSTVIDDRLCLLHEDDEASAYQTEFLLKVSATKDIRREPVPTLEYGRDYGVHFLDKEFRESLRKGSNALYFASSRTSNETWLPLIEKAYAKAHGDYQAIHGGFAGEGIEDLTGGVATYIPSESILDKDKLWSELLQVNKNFLFGCGSRQGRDFDPTDDDGFVRGHAYTVLEAREIEAPPPIDKRRKKKPGKDAAGKEEPTEKRKVRLLKLHNPWGKTEWSGPWSDGSAEWTSELMRELDHTFGDDGLFWITYTDFLKYYPEIDRIRLIGSDWHVAQQWTSVNVPWTAEYLDTGFKLQVHKEGPVVLVLHQPDERYFRGLGGRYRCELHFRLYKEGEYTYLLRSMEDSGSGRSCSAELNLEPGTYFVKVKITATRDEDKQTHDELIRTYRKTRREKLVAVAQSYDLAHSKGKLRELEAANTRLKRADLHERHQKRETENRQLRKQAREKARLRQKRIREAEKKKLKEKKEARKAQIAKERAEQQAKKPAQEGTDTEQEAAEGKDEEQKREPEKAEDVSAPAATEQAADGDTVKPVAEASQPTAKPAEGENSAISEGSAQASGLPTPATSPDSAEATSDKQNPSATSDNTSVKSQEVPAAELTSEDKAEKPQAADQSTEQQPPQPVQEVEQDKTPAVEALAPGAPEAGASEPDPVDKNNQEQRPAPGSWPYGPPLGFDPRPPMYRNGPPMSPGGAPMRRRRPSNASCGSDVTVSDISSVRDEDFDWEIELDGPAYSDLDEYESEEEPSSTLFAEDPWNATCVIGLRVCSEKDAEIRIEVVHGVEHASEASG